jgi:hypothetical protein
MLTLADIKDWFKTLTIENTVVENFYIGKLDNKKEKSVGFYQLNTNNIPNIAIGGLDNTKYDKKPISMLIHWNNNADDTEKVAVNIYNELRKQKYFLINNIRVYFIQLLVNEPIDVGTDSANVYERVIQAIFYYEK